MKTILSFLIVGFLNMPVLAQKVYRSFDRWGNSTGECLALIEKGKIFRASGAFCMQGDCFFVVERNKVYKSGNVFGTFTQDCLFVWDGRYLYESEDYFGNFGGNVVFTVIQNRIYRANSGQCLYIIEDNKVFNSWNPSGTMKDDCILVLEGTIEDIVPLLVVLARRF